MTMTKEERYIGLLPQVRTLCEGETDEIARMANVAALLHGEFGFWWTGFYRVRRRRGNSAVRHQTLTECGGGDGDYVVGVREAIHNSSLSSFIGLHLNI